MDWGLLDSLGPRFIRPGPAGPAAHSEYPESLGQVIRGFVRLYEDMELVRIDSHFSIESGVGFNIEVRNSVNDPGFKVTDDPMPAAYSGTATTNFSNSRLPADNWLYLEIVIKDTGELPPKEGDPGTTEPPAGSIDGEILGLLTITITCVTK